MTTKYNVLKSPKELQAKYPECFMPLVMPAMIITRKSTLSGKIRHKELPITKQQFKNWQNGMLVQNAMTYLTKNEREFIITGSTPEEWEQAFGESI